MASKANIEFDMSLKPKWIDLSVYCFNDSLKDFFDMFCEKLCNFDFFDDKDAYNRSFEKIVKKQNKLWGKEPYLITESFANTIMKVGSNHKSALKTVANLLSYEDYKDFLIERKWYYGYIEALFNGNL